MRAVTRSFWLLLLFAVGLASVAAPLPKQQVTPRGTGGSGSGGGGGGNIKIECTVQGQALVNFGNYDTMSSNPLDAQGRVSYSCRPAPAGSGGGGGNGGIPSAHVRITIGTGLNNSYNRAMLGPEPNGLQYNLFMDPQHRQVWGDCLLNTYCYNERAQLDGTEVVIPVYGRIFGGQDVVAGVYGDSVIVQLDF